MSKQNIILGSVEQPKSTTICLNILAYTLSHILAYIHSHTYITIFDMYTTINILGDNVI